MAWNSNYWLDRSIKSRFYRSSVNEAAMLLAMKTLKCHLRLSNCLYVTVEQSFSVSQIVGYPVIVSKVFALKIFQLSQDLFGTPTWPQFHCVTETPIWPPWRHVKTLYNWRLVANQNWTYMLVWGGLIGNIFVVSNTRPDTSSHTCKLDIQWISQDNWEYRQPNPVNTDGHWEGPYKVSVLTGCPD